MPEAPDTENEKALESNLVYLGLVGIKVRRLARTIHGLTLEYFGSRGKAPIPHCKVRLLSACRR